MMLGGVLPLMGGILGMMLGGVLSWCIRGPHGEVIGFKGASTLDRGAGIATCAHSHGWLADTRRRDEKNTDETGPRQG